MTAPPQGRPKRLVTPVLAEADGGVGLKIPGFGIEIYGEDLPELVERAEEQLWTFENSGQPMRGEVTLVVTRVTKDEFGPTCFEG